MSEVIKILNPIQYNDISDGFFYISTKKFGRKYFSNNERIIIDQINDHVPYGEIVNIYGQKYNIELHEATKQVNSLLNELLYLGVIPLNNIDLLKSNEQIQKSVNIAGDSQFVDISRIIVKKFDTVNNIYCSTNRKSVYNPYLLRARCLNNSEVLFYTGFPDDLNIIGVSGFPQKGAPLLVTLLYSESLKVSEICELFSNVVEISKKYNKRKIKLEINKEACGLLKECIDGSGFVFEALLKCEDQDLPRYIYSKYL